MKTDAVVKVFGSVRTLAQKLRISKSAIYQWGGEVPRSRQFEIEILSGGALKADSQESRRKAA